MKKLVAAIILLTFTSCSEDVPVKQAAGWTIYNTSNSALSSDQIQAIVIENDIKWVGTPAGLTRIDGDQWSTFTTANASLPSDFITSIAVDKSGNTWVGTDKGLGKYDGTVWSVSEKFANQFITKLHYDSRSNILWIGTDKGLGKYDGIAWERYDDPESALMDMYVSSLATASDGTLWMGSFDHFAFVGRLLKYDGDSWTSYKLDQRNLNSCFPDVLAVDSENVVWMGVKGTMGGMVVRIDGDRWDIYNRFTSAHFGGGGITAITLADNVKWITSSTGITCYDNTTWRSFTKTNSGLPDDHILTMVIDKAGNKWFGTLTNGLVVWADGAKSKR
ncbi:two-component regulator propeller domain-containing protein [Chryseolinea sp. H1M3-3]|uniref:ligand-binding sensor domain-containing protein n=1 Tax=Chryseolinea sp. H1M3-3 TaxID=3034144 RepID=UPI0023ED9677|nr:two-component regulator propeller domain-containing protein [Chryseolinea sp. H1M3-3]